MTIRDLLDQLAEAEAAAHRRWRAVIPAQPETVTRAPDRKSTRLNSSHRT